MFTILGRKVLDCLNAMLICIFFNEFVIRMKICAALVCKTECLEITNISRE